MIKLLYNKSEVDALLAEKDKQISLLQFRLQDSKDYGDAILKTCQLFKEEAVQKDAEITQLKEDIAIDQEMYNDLRDKIDTLDKWNCKRKEELREAWAEIDRLKNENNRRD